MSLEKIVEQILSSRPDLTREEVLKMIEKKKMEAQAFFVDEAAARIVATELGVKIPRKPFFIEVLIQDLVSGLNDVTVTGRVIIVSPPKVYTRLDLTEGRFARLLIADQSGTLKVILWDDKTDLLVAGKVEQGQIIKVLHGYVREGLDGNPELHVGQRGEVQVSPPDVVENNYPPITQSTRELRVAEIKEEGGPVTVEGIVATPPIARDIVTQRKEKVTVASFELKDSTGRIRVSAWRSLAEVVKDLTVGTRVRIQNAYVRKGFANRPELTSRDSTSIKVQNAPLG